MDGVTLAAIVTAVGGVALGALNWRRESGKEKSDRFTQLVGAFDQLADNLRQDITRLRAEHKECLDRLAIVEAEVRVFREKTR